jgi:hypothetical protein
MSYVHDDQYGSLLGRCVRNRAVLVGCRVDLPTMSMGAWTDWHTVVMDDPEEAVSVLREQDQAIERLTAENAALREKVAAYEVVRLQLTERGDNYLRECVALRKDAERYRWLRDRAWPFEFNGDTPEDADAAIDAAMHLAARPAAAKKHTPECSYWDGLMAQVCNCGLAERDHNDD